MEEKERRESKQERNSQKKCTSFNFLSKFLQVTEINTSKVKKHT